MQQTGDIPLRYCTVMMLGQQYTAALLAGMRKKKQPDDPVREAPPPCQITWKEVAYGGALQVTYIYPNDGGFSERPLPATVGRIPTLQFEVKLFNATITTTPYLGTPGAPRWELHGARFQSGTETFFGTERIDAALVDAVNSEERFRALCPASLTGGNVTVYGYVDGGSTGDKPRAPEDRYYAKTTFGGELLHNGKPVDIVERFPFGNAYQFEDAWEGAELLFKLKEAETKLWRHRRYNLKTV